MVEAYILMEVAPSECFGACADGMPAHLALALAVIDIEAFE